MRRQALIGDKWDLVISDHSLPRFSSVAALQVLREQHLDIPFIIASGAIGEDAAVAALQSGADDYLLKHSMKRLVPAIKQTLTEAIAAGGSSLRDYVQPDGELGYFQHAWKVYGREGEPCPDCPSDATCDGVRRIVQAGRSTFYCPRNQH